MLYKLKYFFIRLDPLHASSHFVINLIFVTLITSFIWLYIQPPSYAYLLTTPIITEISASCYDLVYDKIKAILLGCVIFAVGVMLFSVFDSAKGILLLVMFVYCFLSLSTSMIKPAYHIIACVAIALSTASFSTNPSWYFGVNAVINIFLVGLISIIVNVIFSFKRKNHTLYLFTSLLKIYLQRLQLIKLSLRYNTNINIIESSQLMSHELALRTRFLSNLDTSGGGYMLDLIRITPFRASVNKLRFTILSLLSINDSTEINLVDNGLIKNSLNCMIVRLSSIIDYFESGSLLPVYNGSDPYNQYNKSFEECSSVNSIAINKLYYHLSNLNHDLDQIENFINSRLAHDN